MKLNINTEFIRNKNIVSDDENNLIFLSDTYKDFEKFENTFYFKRIDTKNIYDEQYLIIVDKRV